MASLKLTIRRSMPNADGSFNIKVSVAALGKTCFIPTRFSVASLQQWRQGRVVRRPDADVLNRKLTLLLLEYEDLIADNGGCEGMSAAEVRDFLVRRSRMTNVIRDYGERFVQGLLDEGRVSYAQNMGYSLRYLYECFGEGVTFEDITPGALERWESFFVERGYSGTTINIRMSHLKALLNRAVDDEVTAYRVFPFRRYRMPGKEVRDICISREELRRLRDAVFEGVSGRRFALARDLFMLSFYCAGINLADVVGARFDGDFLTFVRKKTADRKTGEKVVSFTIQPEARVIAERYMGRDGRLDFGYGFRDYEQFRSFVTKSLNRIGVLLGFEKRLMFYSARKTFCQFGYELGVPLYVLEYAIGQTIKDANRPIFNYIRVMRSQADEAVRRILDYAE